MPLSSKKIIEYIENLPNSFQKKDLIDYFITLKSERSKKNGASKSKKKKKPRQDKDVKKIEETLSALINSGFIARKKNILYKLHPFEIEGHLAVNSSGNAILTAAEGDQFIISEDNVGLARHNDYVKIIIIDYKKGFFQGKVLTVLERDREIYSAKIIKKTKGIIFFQLLDVPGVIEVCAVRAESEPANEDLIIIKLTDGLIANKQGCEILNYYPNDDEQHDIDRIRAKYNLPYDHDKYPELETIENDVAPHELQNRKDYRNLFTVTIDGDDAKDFDDAISIESGADTTTLYVHIADVSAYVKVGSSIDKEAYQRGTSYYLGNTVIPMLPEKLSNNLCSLTEGNDKLTLSVEMIFNNNGEILNYRFHRGLIQSNKRLTYTLAQKILEEKKPEQLYAVLRSMETLATTLKNKRMKAGRLDLNLPEAKLLYHENNVIGIKITERLISHNIIEEFMLSANEIVSRVLTQKHVPTLYRVHESISEDSVESLKMFLRHLGIRYDKNKFNIQNILDQVAGKEYEQVVNLVVLKSLMQAYYGNKPLGHFGLGFKDYTHFTSPIRRYPDLIVHRCLKSLIDKSDHVYTDDKLIRIGEQSSTMERIAQKAERDLVKIKSCRLLEKHIGDCFDGIISGVSKYGFYVTLSEMPIEGMVPMRNLSDDYYNINEDEFCVIGRKYGKRFRLGDPVQIKVETVDIDRMRIDFELV